MRFGFLLTVFLLTGFSGAGQDRATLNGYVRDAANGEEIIGASIYIRTLQAGTVTNDYGFYALTVPVGIYEVEFRSLGYQTIVRTVDLSVNQSMNIDLVSEVSEFEEIVIEGEAPDRNVTSAQMGKNTIDISQVKKLPALFGEADIIKNIQMMPGVITAGEGTSAFFVRGGSGDQNLILIDEAPVYDPSHLFGLISVFNPDVIKDSEIYRGGIPARFGGRLSSIVDVRTKDGNNQNYDVTGGIGTLASRVAIEGPLNPGKSSFILSGRRSYADVFLRLAGEQTLLYFYDVNAKVNWKHNNSNRFFAAIYAGRDVLSLNDRFGFSWGNITGTFRWNHLFNDRLFMNSSLIASQFDYGLELEDAVQGFRWESSLKELTWKSDLSYSINTNNELSFGYHATVRRFAPGDLSPNTPGSIFQATGLQNLYAIDHAVYVGNQHTFDRFMIDAGVRLSVFQNTGKGDVFLYEDPQDNIDIRRTDTLSFEQWATIKTYVNAEPRLALRYSIGERESVKLSYNRMVQNTHLIASGTIPVPFNTWNPSSYYLKPQLADQVAGGYFRNFADNVFETSLEVYYKWMENVTDFADNAQLFFNKDLTTEFRQGKSWSYGAELMINKREGKLIGMFSYTWSKTMREVPGVNRSMPFPANHDRRHVLNLQAAYDVNPRWILGGTFSYSTGRPITLPAGKFEYSGYNPDVLTERNSYRLPAFHRLDLSATLNPRPNTSRKWKGQWVFSIYNVYNRKNPFTVFTRTKKDKEGNIVGDGTEKEARLLYLFPILPSITYNFKF